MVGLGMPSFEGRGEGILFTLAVEEEVILELRCPRARERAAEESMDHNCETVILSLATNPSDDQEAMVRTAFMLIGEYL